jgi:hypothetical protein
MCDTYHVCKWSALFDISIPAHEFEDEDRIYEYRPRASVLRFFPYLTFKNRTSYI